ncbi:hypothetical protein CA850_29775 [Micromonospora echinospora]|uniref:Major tail protein n=1 Tax=Micromonospora echinospora TaxID=1877 RepID=A0A1C5ABE5_MICEC|nr:hypothetical protein [Micromonospora echinospora]OZV74769.1 hypothetical protein CA850_29775 [Micromonospora echinospora]SCF42344.1 hypothetical protein GA0070618_6646 [Micromonospora echinospora]
MAGDPSKAGQWAGADVFIAPPGTAGPTDLTTPWGPDWGVAGLLDGEEGFVWERDMDESESYAWGGILVRKTRSKHKRTVKFVALEDNDVTFELANPGSTRTTTAGLTTATIKVPQDRDFAIGFELRDGNKVKRRTVKRATADVDGEVKEAETELTAVTFLVTLYPESDATLYTELSGEIV